MRRSRITIVGFTVCGVLFSAAPNAAQEDLDELAANQMNSLRTGIAAGLYYDGAIAFLDAWGTPGHGDSVELTPDHLIPIPEFTPVLLATTVRALAAGEMLDLSAPIGNYAPDLADEIRTITFEQLLTHTAGLDDAVLLEHQSWTDAAEKLPNEALFTEPGAIYSYSRYSYPLMAHVLERMVGAPVTEVIPAALTGPLGMTRTTLDVSSARPLGLATGYRRGDEDEGEPDVVAVDPEGVSRGLPATYTTVSDILRFYGAIFSGAIAGGGTFDVAPEAVTPKHAEIWVDGLRLGTYRETAQLVLATGEPGIAARIRLLPESQTVFVAWANGSYPTSTASFIEGQVAARLELPEPDRRTPTPLVEPTIADPEAWTGTYRNGEYIIELAWVDAELTYFDGDRHLRIVQIEEGLLAALSNDIPVLRFELMVVDDVRYVHMNGRAYRLQPPE